MASLAAGVEYPLYTPYGNEAAAQGLLDALHYHKAKLVSAVWPKTSGS